MFRDGRDQIDGRILEWLDEMKAANELPSLF
jgi:hypothetical protein